MVNTTRSSNPFHPHAPAPQSTLWGSPGSADSHQHSSLDFPAPAPHQFDDWGPAPTPPPGCFMVPLGPGRWMTIQGPPGLVPDEMPIYPTTPAAESRTEKAKPLTGDKKPPLAALADFAKKPTGKPGAKLLAGEQAAFGDKP